MRELSLETAVASQEGLTVVEEHIVPSFGSWKSRTLRVLYE